jgi:hypothetical protein
VEEGRHIEAGNGAPTSDKVVRLPRDWLGPREHLVPFGAATTPPAPVESEPADFAPDDFWGERSAAIHNVVQAPEAPTPPGPAEPSRSKSRLGRRGLAAACLLGVAAAVAIVLTSTGSPRHAAGGARLNMAAVLRTGVSRGSSRIHPPRIVARRTVPRTVKHVPHRVRRRKATPVLRQHHTSPPPTATYVARSAPPPAQPTYRPVVSRPTPHVYTSPPPAASTASSGAKVSPTGQSGALGPVQSPNG